MTTIDVQDEHRWLHRLLGDWTYESECALAPGEPPMKARGEETVRALGELWVLCEGRGQMPGGGAAAQTLVTLGYDLQQGGYVGTWVGSMMSRLWVYAGSMDATQRVLTLESEGPDFVDQDQLATYRDVIELVSNDRRVLSSQVRAEDGSWGAPFMTAHYRRRW